MPRRRAIGNGLLAASQAITPMLGAYTRYLQQQQQNENILDRQTSMDLMNYSQGLQDKVAKGEITPGQASAMFHQQTGKNIPFDDAAPSLASRTSAISKDISDAPTLSALPTEERVKRRMTELRIPDQTPQMESNSGIGHFPLVSGVSDSPEFSSLMGELNASRDKLQAQVPSTGVDDINPSTGVARRRFVPNNRLGDLGDLATERSGGQEGERQGAITEAKTPYDVAAANETELGTRNAKIGTTVATEQAMQGPRAATAGAVRNATLDAEFDPKFVNARVDEAGRKAVAEAQASGDRQMIQLAAMARKGAGDAMTIFNKLVGVSSTLNTREGLGGRMRGAELTAKAALGQAPAATTMDQLLQQMLRPVARTMGIAEANVSEGETKQALKGLGIGLWSTATERRNGLRNLRDLITVGPMVGSRLGSNASIGERMSMAQQFIQQRQQVESDAIKAGAGSFLDPVTGAITAVVQ